MRNAGRRRLRTDHPPPEATPSDVIARLAVPSLRELPTIGTRADAGEPSRDSAPICLYNLPSRSIQDLLQNEKDPCS